MIEDTFRRSVEDHGLLRPGDRVLAAVSGGGDSVALLRLLASYAGPVPLTIVVAHVNHGLRGDTSDGDQRFVEELAACLGLACVVLAARRAGSSRAQAPEEALRLERHALLRGAAKEASCSAIALAHTMDDQAETVLMRLLRGSGRRGLSGMAPRGPGRLVRPLLGVRRAEVRSYLATIGQPCREDETNADPRYLRNKVRASLVPVMEEINPAIVEVLSRTSGILAEEDRFLDDTAAGWLSGNRHPAPASESRALAIGASDLASLPPAIARRVARLAIRETGGDPRGAGLVAVSRLLSVAAGRPDAGAADLGGGIACRRLGDALVISRARTAPEGSGAAGLDLAMRIPGSLDLPGGEGRLASSVAPAGPGPAVPGPEESGGRAALLDADLLGETVTVRTRRAGDVFHPLGAPGRRRLKAFLIDRKVPRQERDRVLLVVGPAGIAWVVGHRIAHPYRITRRTRRIARLEYTGRLELPFSKRII